MAFAGQVFQGVFDEIDPRNRVLDSLRSSNSVNSSEREEDEEEKRKANQFLEASAAKCAFPMVA